ncbi:DUF1707 domain-containing protein [Amycolatopsis sp. NBC_01488]|uniref:hypothetical protein n=1 Tax=Amycolatopsis sp. NBC_01488 TaxID=2903563 RepID=UPI002E27F6CB|nr:hypothetical protein [Amycolatopsis sp. NBC_01488]
MSENRPVATAVGRLLWPERTRVTELDRKLAVTRIEHARAEGRCEDAEVRLARVRTATTHAELDSAVSGRSASAVPPILEAAPRVGLAVWVVVSLVNLVVYLTIGMVSGQWDGPWVLWPVLGGGLLVLGLWSTRERDRRMRLGDG